MYLGLFSSASQISLSVPISFLKSTGLATSILGCRSLVFKHSSSPCFQCGAHFSNVLDFHQSRQPLFDPPARINVQPPSGWGQLLSAEYWGEDLKIVCCWRSNNPTYSPTFTSSSRICQGLSFGVLRYNLIASNLSPVPVYDSAYSGLLIPSPLIHLLSSFLSFVPTVTSPGPSVFLQCLS